MLDSLALDVGNVVMVTWLAAHPIHLRVVEHARAAKLGRKPEVTEHQKREAIHLGDNLGEPKREIAGSYNDSHSTISLWLPKIASGLAQLPRWATLIAGMIDLLKLLGGLLGGVFRSHAAREAEMAFLRQQLVVLQRSAPARLRLRAADRVIFVWLYRLYLCLPIMPSERSTDGDRRAK